MVTASGDERCGAAVVAASASPAAFSESEDVAVGPGWGMASGCGLIGMASISSAVLSSRSPRWTSLRGATAGADAAVDADGIAGALCG